MAHFLFSSFPQDTIQIKLIKACEGLEPVAAGWKVHTNPPPNLSKNFNVTHGAISLRTRLVAGSLAFQQ